MNDLMRLKAAADFFYCRTTNIDPRYRDGMFHIKNVPVVINGKHVFKETNLAFPIVRGSNCQNPQYDLTYFKAWVTTVIPLAEIARYAAGSENILVEFEVLQCVYNTDSDILMSKKKWYHVRVRLNYYLISHGVVVAKSFAEVDTQSRAVD